MSRNWGKDHKPFVTALSCVSAPISPRQQCHLAFISEFNVQMLYLSGLKMLLPIFCPAHTHPMESSGTVSIMTAAGSLDFKAMAAEQNH
jgi:hypothetical protein